MDDEGHIAELVLHFAPAPEMLPVYLAVGAVREECEKVRIRVQKTQVTLSNRYNFACASLPVRRKKGWPDPCLMVTFGLGRRLDAPRVAVAIEPYPGRWTHHVLVTDPVDIDDELMAWVREAYEFSMNK